MLGSGGIYRKDGLTITGKGNTVRGNRCTIIGEENEIWGNDCTVIGKNNVIYGKRCKILGSKNKLIESVPRRFLPADPGHRNLGVADFTIFKGLLAGAPLGKLAGSIGGDIHIGSINAGNVTITQSTGYYSDDESSSSSDEEPNLDLFVHRGIGYRKPSGSYEMKTSGSKVIVNGELYYDTSHPSEGYWPERTETEKAKKEVERLKRLVREMAATAKTPPGSGSEDSGDEEDRGKCAVCLVADAIMVFTGCGHMCLCEPCQVEVGAKCPICRKESECIRTHST